MDDMQNYLCIIFAFVKLFFKWYWNLDGWWDRIFITFNDLTDPISLLSTACLLHVPPLQSSARCITVHAPRAMWTQNASFVKNVRYVNVAGEVKKSCGLSFLSVVLSSMYRFIWARAGYVPPFRNSLRF